MGVGVAARFAKAPVGTLTLSRRSQTAFRKERRKACGLRLVPGKHHSLVVSRSAALPPRPGRRLELLEPFLFFKKYREAREGKAFDKGQNYWYF